MATSKREFSFFFFQSITCENPIGTKQIYLSPTFLKSWSHISDNITGVVGGCSITRGDVGIGK